MEAKDINGMELFPGDKVVCQDNDGVAFGEISHGTGNSIIIQISSPYVSKRQINYDLTRRKVYKIDGSN